MRIIVIGGSGNFGARICRALKEDPSLEVVAAGRRARAAARALRAVGGGRTRIEWHLTAPAMDGPEFARWKIESTLEEHPA